MNKLLYLLVASLLIFSCSREENNEFVHQNQITIKCPDSEIGDKFTVNGKEYTVVDKTILKELVSKDEDVTCVCTSKVTKMAALFENKKEFNQDIGDWDVSNVTDMRLMFSGAVVFNQDIGDWDTSNVTTMDTMFYGTSSFNQDLSSWCVTNISSEPRDFSKASALTNANKPIWGTCPTD